MTMFLSDSNVQDWGMNRAKWGWRESALMRPARYNRELRS
jgi:hypothetical protein